MAHFDEVLPGKIHRVGYERLVESPESEIARLLDYLELPFDESCLRFYENNRVVQTVSDEQVRMPINRLGLDSWRRYEEWLDPLKSALGSVLDAYPDVPQSFHTEMLSRHPATRSDRHLWSELQLSRVPQVLQFVDT
jgi:hypothetical protein